MKYFLISEVELNTLVDSSSHMLNDDISDAIRSRPLPAPALTPYECGDGCKGELLEQWRIEKYSDSMDLYLNGVFITKCKDMTSVNCVQNAIWQVAEKKARQAREDVQPFIDFVRVISTKRNEMLDLMCRNKIKIDNLDDPMQKLAFTFYSEIGEMAHKAEVIIEESTQQQAGRK